MTRAQAEVGSAANSYEILAKLAIGGMAEIFLARGASTAGVERYVVLKRVLRHRASDFHFVQMFLDEARLAAQLQHPNIAQVYDIGKLGDSYFFTMEYVHGETVRTLLQRSHGLRRTIPIGSVLSIVAGAAAGLHHAHERKGMDGKHLGIVHRDVSPSNLMVSYEGTVKVVDFGVAKATHRSQETQSGTVKGKICYMSPEQCRGGEIDRRSDLFSLGIVLWEMLTTERLFRRASDFENMQAIVSETVPPPSSLRPEIPPELDHIVMRLLQKEAVNRYQSADELHEAIENAAMRTGSVLSTASLGRYMRELFGQRPEPWVELTSLEQHPEPFTVTSEPLAIDLSVVPVDDVDLKLNAMPHLPRMSAQQTAAQTPQAMIGPTVPLRVHAEDMALTVPFPNVVPFSPGQRPINAASAARPQSASRTGPRDPLGQAAAPPPLSPSYPPRPHSPSTTPQSQSSYPVLSQAAYSVAHAASYSKQQRPPRKSRALFIIVPAIAIGIGIGLVLALGGDDKIAAKPAEKTETVKLSVETPPVEKPAVPTAVAQPEADTPKAAPKPAPDTKPKTEPEPAPDTKPKAESKPDIPTMFKAKSFDNVVAACAAAKSELAQNATVCTVAACKARESSKARRWFATVPASKRAGVAKECGAIVQPEQPAKQQPPPPPDDPCKHDMMACQH